MGKLDNQAKRALHQIWSGVNVAVFDGKLEEPRFELRRLRKDWGQFKRLPVPTIIIARQFFEGHPDYSLAELVATVGHECIHMLQAQEGRPMRHDRYFTAWARKLGYR